MTWQVDYLAEQQVVAATVSATVGIGEISEAVARGLVVAGERATGAILIDARQMKLAAQTTELYRLPEIVGGLGLTRSHRVAVLIADNSEQMDSFLFVETVFFNRGFPVRLFTEVTAALKWLKSGKRPLRPASGSSPNQRPRPS
ncbi:MAG: hypothetical protein RBS72_15550 [Sedimentisphaerales bacterium]|jgi:hypothetical protein|nr:hypothetical protein [Sedimentisphaerales bacterium]HNY78994.1 hypothetical protein [Sedimentisphaerales bacterium]HOC64057.1 hypothetical protein [Sedimentisphaerales bacterium]HOH64908.1 hypothetical protein [Sedimentisphaerales bacterium]HPY52218.1 hypothetical protein [Sedimentisphaerales bacterium]